MASKMDTETHYSDVWVVIPAFNEAAVIGKVVTDVRSVFDHVVCVDDGSTDGTGDIARRSVLTSYAIRSTWARGGHSDRNRVRPQAAGRPGLCHL